MKKILWQLFFGHWEMVIGMYFCGIQPMICLVIEIVSIECISGHIVIDLQCHWESGNIFLWHMVIDLKCYWESVIGIYFYGIWSLTWNAIESASSEYIFMAYGHWPAMLLRVSLERIFVAFGWSLSITVECFLWLQCHWQEQSHQIHYFLMFWPIIRLVIERVNGTHFCGIWLIVCIAIEKVSMKYILWYLAIERWSMECIFVFWPSDSHCYWESQWNIFLWHMGIGL